MNIVQLRTFVNVIELGSFSEAARAMGISQPAVTMQVQSLEAAVGATLLDRRYRRVDLTEAGKALLPHASVILAQVDAAKEEIAALSGTITGRLTIAASTTPGDYVIPRLLGGFIERFP
ncbi:MAG: LysR family transcriptional regulator, partial [Actinobacteria bacterium]